MEIILYSNKQILGGFVLIFIIGLLFVINLTMSNSLSNHYQGINLSYFVGPLIFTICMLSILYISSLKKSMQLTMDKYILPDNFTMIGCPDGYNRNSFDGNVQCVPIDNGTASVPAGSPDVPAGSPDVPAGSPDVLADSPDVPAEIGRAHV